MKSIFAGCLTIILQILIGPIINFIGGWLGGLVVQCVCSDTLVGGLNILFGTERFTSDLLPIICGTLGVVGSFFRNTTISTE